MRKKGKRRESRSSKKELRNEVNEVWKKIGDVKSGKTVCVCKQKLSVTKMKVVVIISSSDKV